MTRMIDCFYNHAADGYDPIQPIDIFGINVVPKKFYLKRIQITGP